MEKVAKIEGVDIDNSKYLYFIKKYDDGLYVCRTEQARGRNKKK